MKEKFPSKNIIQEKNTNFTQKIVYSLDCGIIGLRRRYSSQSVFYENTTGGLSRIKDKQQHLIEVLQKYLANA